jgi:transposase
MLAGGTEDKEHAMSQKLDTSPAVIGIDIGKNSFHIVGQNQRGAIVLRQKWSRGQVEARLANLPPCRIGMEACVGAHHLSRTLKALGHDARLMPAKYVRPYSKGQKNDYRDAEAIAEAVQRPTMKFVATKTVDQLDLQALHRVRERFVGQRTGIINQIRAFMLERGIAVRQGLRFLRAELPGILATRTDALSPRMLRILEDLMADWRRLDARIGDLSSEIEALARQDKGCERLMSVPGIGPIISSAMVAAIGTGSCRNGYPPATARSSAAYRSAAIAICAVCSFRPPGSCWSRSGQSIGTATGSSRGSRPQGSAYTTTCWRLRSPTSSLASPGRFFTRGAPSSASRPMKQRTDPLNPRAVLGPVKAWPGNAWRKRQGKRDGQP